MFEYFDHIDVYSPGAGADNPLGSKFFSYINLLSPCILPASFPPFNYILLIIIIALLWKSGAILDSPCPSVVP